MQTDHLFVFHISGCARSSHQLLTAVTNLFCSMQAHAWLVCQRFYYGNVCGQLCPNCQPKVTLSISDTNQTFWLHWLRFPQHSPQFSLNPTLDFADNAAVIRRVMERTKPRSKARHAHAQSWFGLVGWACDLRPFQFRWICANRWNVGRHFDKGNVHHSAVDVIVAILGMFSDLRILILSAAGCKSLVLAENSASLRDMVDATGRNNVQVDDFDSVGAFVIWSIVACKSKACGKREFRAELWSQYSSKSIRILLHFERLSEQSAAGLKLWQKLSAHCEQWATSCKKIRNTSCSRAETSATTSALSTKRCRKFTRLMITRESFTRWLQSATSCKKIQKLAFSRKDGWNNVRPIDKELSKFIKTHVRVCNQAVGRPAEAFTKRWDEHLENCKDFTIELDVRQVPLIFHISLGATTIQLLPKINWTQTGKKGWNVFYSGSLPT